MSRFYNLRTLIPLGVLAVFVLIVSLSLIVSILKSEEILEHQSRETIKRDIASLARLAERIVQSDPQLLEETGYRK